MTLYEPGLSLSKGVGALLRLAGAERPKVRKVRLRMNVYH